MAYEAYSIFYTIIVIISLRFGRAYYICGSYMCGNMPLCIRVRVHMYYVPKYIHADKMMENANNFGVQQNDGLRVSEQGSQAQDRRLGRLIYEVILISAGIYVYIYVVSSAEKVMMVS